MTLTRLILAALLPGILATVPSCQNHRPPCPFTTDGCSAFPDGTAARPDAWRAPCVIHDIAYWRGGFPRTARWMYYGTRLGGGPWWPTPWRWGYGWPWGRGYRPLDEVERAQVTALMPSAHRSGHP
jgi:hypothetical protein